MPCKGKKKKGKSKVKKTAKQIDYQAGVKFILSVNATDKTKEEQLEVKSLRNLLKTIRKIGQRDLDIQRYKGLGEMNPGQLWDTTMDPEKRSLLKVTIEDGVKADRMFTILMGEEVEPRRAFIEKHALEVKNLDR